MTWRLLFPLLALLLAFPVSSLGAQLQGVTMADTFTAYGKTLRLNGMGLRTKLMFKVYVGGLYVETPSHDAATLIRTDQVRQVRLHLLMGLSGEKIASAVREGFDLNSHAQMGALQARLDRLCAMFPALKEGEEVWLTYVPGKGTVVSAKGKEMGTLEGKDFADALFSVWLGGKPADSNLKKGMLGT